MHLIRLRDPWDSELTAQGWRFARCFQKPTGLAEQDQVFLEIETIALAGLVRLNGSELGLLVPHCLNRWEIGKLLQFRNAILIELEFSGELAAAGRKVPGTVVGEVRLAIESVTAK